MIKKKITGFSFFIQIVFIIVINIFAAKGLQSLLLPDFVGFGCFLVCLVISLLLGMGHNLKTSDDDIKEERIIPVIGTRVVTTDDIDYVKGIPTQKQFEEHLIEQDIRPQNGESRRVSEFKGILYPPVKEVEIIHEPNKAL